MRCMTTRLNGLARGCAKASCARLAIATFLLAALVGCAAQGTAGNTNVAAMQGATPAGPALSTFLDNAIPGSVIQVAQSPWGPDVGIMVLERYFAASGRTCIQLNVLGSTPTSLRQTRLACQVDGQGWFAQRLVTDVLEGTAR